MVVNVLNNSKFFRKIYKKTIASINSRDFY